jgi:hypothetical protein
MEEASTRTPGGGETDAEARKTTSRPLWRRIFQFWLVNRIFLFFWGAIGSMLIPQSLLEKSVAVWPPSFPIGVWLGRVLLAPWDRWDVEHFMRITTVGYRGGEGTLAFHPLFPLAGKWIGLLLGGRPLLGMMILSNVCGFLFLIALVRLAEKDLPSKQAYRAALYFLALPTAFVLFAPYTESLFLLLSVWAFLMAREKRWAMAGLAGGLATLTRQQGLFLLLPLAWELWQDSGKSLKTMFGRWREIAGLAFIPAGYGVWVIYRAVAANDVSFDLRNPQRLIYGLLLSPNSTKIVANQKIVPPWEAIWYALMRPEITNVIDLTLGGIYLALFGLLARRLWRMRQSYFLYTLVIFLVSFSLSTGLPHAYMGLPRHCLLAFPLVFPLAIAGENRWVNMAITFLSFFLLLTLTLFYVGHILWVP